MLTSQLHTAHHHYGHTPCTQSIWPHGPLDRSQICHPVPSMLNACLATTHSVQRSHSWSTWQWPPAARGSRQTSAGHEASRALTAEPHPQHDPLLTHPRLSTLQLLYTCDNHIMSLACHLCREATGTLQMQPLNQISTHNSGPSTHKGGTPLLDSHAVHLSTQNHQTTKVMAGRAQLTTSLDCNAPGHCPVTGNTGC